MGIWPQKHPLRSVSYFASLDLGNHKVCGAVAHIDSKRDREFLSTIHVSASVQQASVGIQNYQIVELEALEDLILTIIHQLEKKTSQTIHRVSVSVPTALLQTQVISVWQNIGYQPITEKDLRKLFETVRNQARYSQHQILHTLPIHYELDRTSGIQDPRGMVGEILKAHFLIVWVPSSWMMNVTHCLSRCRLEATQFISSTYAASSVIAVPDEKELGVTIIDLGSQGTSFCSFLKNNLVFQGQIRIGGQQITYDIARGIGISIAQAERLKTFYGSLLGYSSEEERENILITLLGEEESLGAQSISRSFLSQMIRARVEEIFELLLKEFQKQKVDRLCLQRFILTGGGSQLQGIREVAQQIFGRPTRSGIQTRLKGGGDLLESPAFSVTAGLLYQTYQEQNNPLSALRTYSPSLWGQFVRLLT
jgi:cell division protein FtsA